MEIPDAEAATGGGMDSFCSFRNSAVQPFLRSCICQLSERHRAAAPQNNQSVMRASLYIIYISHILFSQMEWP